MRLYRKTGSTAIRVAPIYIGAIVLFFALVVAGQVAMGDFDGMDGAGIAFVKVLVMSIPAYLVTIAIVHAAIEEVRN